MIFILTINYSVWSLRKFLMIIGYKFILIIKGKKGRSIDRKRQLFVVVGFLFCILKLLLDDTLYLPKAFQISLCITGYAPII